MTSACAPEAIVKKYNAAIRNRRTLTPEASKQLTDITETENVGDGSRD
jgi:hypothetical protein